MAYMESVRQKSEMVFITKKVTIIMFCLDLLFVGLSAEAVRKYGLILLKFVQGLVARIISSIWGKLFIVMQKLFVLLTTLLFLMSSRCHTRLSVRAICPTVTCRPPRSSEFVMLS